MNASDKLASRRGLRMRGAAAYGLELALIGIAYFVLAKAGLQ